MDYEEAKKKAQAEKPKDNFIVIHLDGKLVLPYKDGMKFLESLANAEKLPRYYSDKQYITPLEREDYSSTSMSRQEYDRYKIAALLNVSYDDVKQMEEAPKQPSQ